MFKSESLRGMAIVAVLFGAVVLLAGCSGPNDAQRVENTAQDKFETNFQQNQPVPIFTYSQIRQNLIEIETAQAQGVQTTSFFFNLGVADPIWSCPSIGAPIASTAQLTNPQKVVYNGSGSVTIGNMDPNGTYQPPDSTGTYAICVDATGKPYAYYWEGYVGTVFGPAKWNYDTHQIELLGPPSFQFSKGQGH